LQRFVKQYANLAKIIGDAAAAYVEDVRSGTFPSEQHTFASTIPTSEAKS
jgi:3-methyl-2-oxobutanoate hydroxymethyltransferase